MMQIFNLISLFVTLGLKCVHQHPDFKIIIHFDEESADGSSNVGGGINGETRKVVGVGGSYYQAYSEPHWKPQVALSTQHERQTPLFFINGRRTYFFINGTRPQFSFSKKDVLYTDEIILLLSGK